MTTLHNKTETQQPPIMAYFVSPHGFGHAARAAAVMTALHSLQPNIRFEIFSTVPQWFFDTSLPGQFGYHRLLSDIGLIQFNALEEDLAATLAALDQFYPIDPARLDPLASQLHQLGCGAVLCDIAPLGLAVAHHAQLPSLLIENFTWDWIYQGYLKPTLEPSLHAGLQRHIDILRHLFALANYHLQTEPLCDRSPRATLTLPPISRAPRRTRAEVRRALHLDDDTPLVILSMGGASWDYTTLDRLKTIAEVTFLIPGSVKSAQVTDNLILLPHQSNFFHPDLIHAADAMVGKVGYSTLAEVYQAGIPYGYITRRQFKEADVLADFVARQMPGLSIPTADFVSGNWVNLLPTLLAISKTTPPTMNAANSAAKFIQQTLF